jgi:hypothetical protein
VAGEEEVMNTMSKLPPLCRYCGKPIAKKTTTVHFAGPRDARPEKPQSKAEVERITNGHVVAVRWSRGEDYYAKNAGHDIIYQASLWDGESYVDPYFCNGDHARLFAYSCAAIKERPLALPAYWTALGHQKAREVMA